MPLTIQETDCGFFTLPSHQEVFFCINKRRLCPALIAEASTCNYQCLVLEDEILLHYSYGVLYCIDTRRFLLTLNCVSKC